MLLNLSQLRISSVRFRYKKLEGNRVTCYFVIGVCFLFDVGVVSLDVTALTSTWRALFFGIQRGVDVCVLFLLFRRWSRRECVS